MRPITELTSRYRLESLIAAGGMGEVWRADDVVLERHRAAAPTASAPAFHPAVARPVRVTAALVGQPLSVARQQLHARGLRVLVQAQPDQDAAPGTVLRVSPTGRLVTGRQVLLTVAVQPPATPSSTPSSHASPTPSGTPSPGSVPPGRAKHTKGRPPGQGGNSQGGND